MGLVIHECRFVFLPVELCGAHYLTIEQLAALKYLPSLLYRVEVCFLFDSIVQVYRCNNSALNSPSAI